MSPVNVELASKVSAFAHELHSASQGVTVDEHALALSMMAAANSHGDIDTSKIKESILPIASAASTADGPAAPRDRFDEFADMMLNDLKSPDKQVEDHKVPKPPPVVIEDPINVESKGYDKAEAAKNFSYLKDAHSICQMFSNIMLMKSNPGGFDITTQAAEAFNTQAKLAYNAMAGPMHGIYIFNQGAHTKHNFTIPQNQIHEKLLETMFDGMGLDTAHKKQIDSQVTNFVKGLKSITVGGNDDSKLDFALRFGLTPATNITADDTNPIWQFEPMTYLVYLTMDAGSFRRAISKHDSEAMINFKYEHVITKFELNVNKFLQIRPKYDKMFETATGMSLKEYSDKLNKSVKK